MGEKYEFIRGTVLLIGFGIVMAVTLVQWLRRSKDAPPVLISKWIVTGLLVIFCCLSIPWLGLGAPFFIVLVGGILSILWTPNLVNTLFRPLWQAIDGGNEAPDPQPFYSIARAKRKRGHFTEALAAVRAQLARFPQDQEGNLLAAEILAEDMNDLPGAEIAIHRFIGQPGITPRQTAFALNLLADWQLKYAQDREAAQETLAQIQTLYPETDWAVAAAQRVAHLATTAQLLEAHDRPRVVLRPGVPNLGLLPAAAAPQPREVDPEKLAADYVAHLELHPLDTEVREKLAVLYADHFQRLDLAVDQLDQLIAHPNQPTKRVIHWLNLLANLHIRHGADYDAARQALEQIIEKFPHHPAAELARNRLDLLKLELKGQTKSQAIRLGVYEQNIGLKRGLPR
jgi:tetratricopeptide (TPR) repeat protein